MTTEPRSTAVRNRVTETCNLSPVTCRCGRPHRPLTTPPGVQLESGETEARRRTRLLIEARTVRDANRALLDREPLDAERRRVAQEAAA